MTVDLRLAVPAAACWLSAGVLCAAPGRAVAAAAGLLWLGAATAIGIALVGPRHRHRSRHRRRHCSRHSRERAAWRVYWPSLPSLPSLPLPLPPNQPLPRAPSRRDRWRTLLSAIGVSLAAAALVATIIAATASVRLPGVLASAAERHAVVTGTVTISSTPTETQSFLGFTGLSNRIRFRGTLTELRLDAQIARVSVPVMVFAESTASASRGLEIGSSVRLAGTVRVAEPGDEAAVLFFGGSPPEVGTGPSWWLAWAGELRRGFSEAATRLPGDGGDLLPGLAIGDTRAVSEELDAAMKTSSLNHLTAVSGANCAVVIASIMLLGGALGLRRGVRIALSLVVLAGFVTLVTPEPSVLRAGLMASLVLLSIGIGRPGGGVPALALIVIVLLAGDPWLSRNYGFVLSVLATAGLLVLAGPLTRALSRWMPAALAALVSIPLAAQLACQPVLVLLSPSLPLYGVPANLLAAPAAPLATVVGLLGCLLLPGMPWLAGAFLGLAWWPAAWIAAIARTAAALPGSRLPWLGGAVGLAGVVLLTLLFLAVIVRRDGTPDRWRRAAALAVLLGSLGAYSGSLIGTGIGRAAAFPDDWQIAACDIGQGDAVVVRDEDRYALVDVGPDPRSLAACLSTLGIDRIDLLVLTHYDLDHIGGIDAVLGRVDTALVGVPENDQDRRLHERLAGGGALLRQSARGDTGVLGRLRWEILWPVRGSPVMQVGNPGSVTIGFDGRGIRSLFLGDLGEEAQDAMWRASRPPPVDVVKVAHHGSADQSPGLYARLRATVGLIGVGAGNGYGHPTDALLTLLSGVGTSAFRTDLRGMVVVAPAVERGGRLNVWTEKTPP